MPFSIFVHPKKSPKLNTENITPPSFGEGPGVRTDGK
tara:strand:- start:5599 stop:5709 length:111 start_codon:yes stop_codon:yes gene_type:complete